MSRWALLNMNQTVGRLEEAVVVPILRHDRDPSEPPWELSNHPDMHSMIARIDTGALSNSLRVEKLEFKEYDGYKHVAYMMGGIWSPWLEFEMKYVKSSNGTIEERPCIMCWLSLGRENQRITEMFAQFTLSVNTKMKHPVLIGRRTLSKNKLSVEVWKSFQLGKTEHGQ